MLKMNTEGDRNRIFINSTIAIAIFVIGLVAVVWIFVSKDDVTESTDSETKTVTMTEESKTTEPATTTKKVETTKATTTPAPTEKSVEQIKVEAITAADIQSQQADYLGAVVTIRMAIEKVGEDAELNELAAAYEKAYQEQLTQQVPETEQETAAPETTEAVAVYANDVLTAFDSDLAWTYSEAKNPEGGSFQMLGKEYKNGVVFHLYCFSSSITYNVDGDYTKMSFYLGHQDNTGMDPVELKVYLDNEFYESYSMAANDVPQLIEIDVRGKQTIRFVADKGYGSGYCLADLMVE